MQRGRSLAFAALFFAVAGSAGAQSPEASLAQDLANCAGAVAAFADLDVISYPDGAEGEWAPVLGAILDGLNREPGVEGMTGRFAASAARSHWDEQPEEEQEAAANACRARFGRE